MCVLGAGSWVRSPVVSSSGDKDWRRPNLPMLQQVSVGAGSWVRSFKVSCEQQQRTEEGVAPQPAHAAAGWEGGVGEWAGDIGVQSCSVKLRGLQLASTQPCLCCSTQAGAGAGS